MKYTLSHHPYAATPMREQPDAAAGANPFANGATAGAITAQGCHECECEEVMAQVMHRVLRVKNMCSDDVCRVEDFDAFRRRNTAISADYAKIYLQPLGEAKRLKFAGGAAFGSTHIGYGMDQAASTLRRWGSGIGFGREPDLVYEDDEIFDDILEITPSDIDEAISRYFITNVGYQATLTGLRRLVYGNLAIYMDLGAVLWFCQMHEERFNFFRDGRVDEFLECFERFKSYVFENHGADHEVYGANGSFGDETQNWIVDGLRAIAENRIGDSLTIIDHEQRTILQNFMYTLGSGVPGDVKSHLGLDQDFENFMNALEEAQLGHGRGTSPLFNGIRAQFSYAPDVLRLLRADFGVSMTVSPTTNQPLMYEFDGGNFAKPDVRTPWFKDVVRHFMRAEANQFEWPSSSSRTTSYSLERGFSESYRIPDEAPDLRRILYADLGQIRGGA